jgi:hypothetical protein
MGYIADAIDWLNGKKTGIGVLLIAVIKFTVDMEWLEAGQVAELLKYIEYFTIGSVAHKVQKGELGNPLNIVKSVIGIFRKK